MYQSYMLYTLSLHNMSMTDISQFLNFVIGGYLLYNAALVSAIHLRGSAICIRASPPFWASPHVPHPTRLGCHRAQSWAPCVTQQLPASRLFPHDSAHVSATLSICPHFSFPHCARKSIMYVFVFMPALKIDSSVPFFPDSLYMH